MKKVSVLLFTLLLLLLGCEKKDNPEEVKKEYMTVVNKEIKEMELNNYFNGKVKLIKTDYHTLEDLTFYDFYLEAKLNNEFENLSDDEKYELLKEIDAVSFDGEYILENSNCSVETFTVKSGNDTYEISPLGFEVVKNGEDFEPEPTTTTTTTNSNSSSNGSSGTNKQAVYNYMKSQYDQITNYGDNYDPEIHDPMVAELAAKRFGISAAEAGQIYIDMEMGY